MIKQPVNQVRLTNVAVVRLRRKGRRFEIACYKNKILNWRNGVESDITEVLQTESIFQNVSKGQLAKATDLREAFGMTDSLAIAQIIGRQGELQVSEKERSVALETITKDICSFVAERSVNAITRTPMTSSMVESALKELGYSVRSDLPAKRQGLRALEFLCEKLPAQVVRAKMCLRITALERQRADVESVVFGECKGIAALPREQPSHLSRNNTDYYRRSAPSACAPAPPSKVCCQDEGVADEKELCDQAAGSVAATTAVALNACCDDHFVLEFYCDPHNYRRLDRLVSLELSPQGVLHIVKHNCVDFPIDASTESARRRLKGDDETLVTGPQRQSDKSLVNKQQTFTTKQQNQEGNEDSGISTTEPNSLAAAAAAPAAPTVSRGVSCAVCNTGFSSAQDLRAHSKSDWHKFNVKRKFRKLPVLEEEEFVGLQLTGEIMMLAVD